MKIYVTTDTHLGHDKLNWMGRGRPDNFSERIFKAISNMSGDLLIHCGDVCIGEDDKNHRAYMEAAKGFKRKFLVRGNHDNNSDSWYYDRGWTAVFKTFSAKYFGKRILFSHSPQIRKDVNFTGSHPLDLNVHGHLHGDYNRHCAKEIYDPEFHKDVCVDDYEFAPVSLEKLIKLNERNNLRL